MLTAAGCAQFDSAINSRDLECNDVPEDMCHRLADHIVSLWSPSDFAEAGPVVRVHVEAADCDTVQKDLVNARCWIAGASSAIRADGSGGEGIGESYFQLADGTLFRGGEVRGRSSEPFPWSSAPLPDPRDPRTLRERAQGEGDHQLHAQLTCHDARVVTTRAALAGGCLALTMLTAAACAQVTEVVTGWELECVGGVPEDICVRLANHLAGQWDVASGGTEGPVVRVLVQPIDCGVLVRRDAAMARCWEGSASNDADANGTSEAIVLDYYERVNGTLVEEDGSVVGN